MSAQTVTFSTAAEGFVDVLALLAQHTTAVTVTLHSGQRFGAVLVSVNDAVLIYERWDKAEGLPSGEPGTVDLRPPPPDPSSGTRCCHCHLHLSPNHRRLLMPHIRIRLKEVISSGSTVWFDQTSPQRG
jgi:hypothetical protein